MKKHQTYIFFVFLLSTFSLLLKAQNAITISLKVNGDNEATVFRDEPVLFDLAVSNQQAQANERWNIAADRRLGEMNELLKKGELKQEDFDKEKAVIEKNKRRTEAVILGTASSTWTAAVSWKAINTINRHAIPLPVRIMKNPPIAGRAVLDANGYYMACYGIDPADLKSVSPGTYTIEVMIGTSVSNMVILKVESTMMSTALAESEAMLLRFGLYYWHEEDAAKTIGYSDKILAKNPASLDGIVLKGDGQVLQKSYLPALDSYNKAIKEYYKQNGTGSEPPEYLFSMIAFVKKEMGE